MSSIDSVSSRGFQIGNAPVLRMADLMKESETMAPEVTDLGNGVVVERRGNMIKMAGSAKMSLPAMAAAFEAARMGGDAGRAMFETYRQTHPEDFDPARIFDPRNPPEPPPLSSTGATPRQTVPSEEAGGDGRTVLKGSAADDFFTVLRGLVGYGLGGNDRLEGESDVILHGGDGDDILSAYANSTLYGGDGNDRLSAYADSTLDGGAGDDRISAYEKAKVADQSGDNDVQVYSASQVVTGAGNDRIHVGDASTVEAGDGFNYIEAGYDSTVISGTGSDMVTAGSGSTVVSGAGDDLVRAGRGADITAGAGDDRVLVDGDATIHFSLGDGNDAVGGGEFGQAYAATDHLSSSILSFGAGIAPGDLIMRRQGNDLVVQVGASDSVTLKDVQRHGIPTMTFADGSVLDSNAIEAVVGPGEPYQPASQAMQRWYDANAAYRAQQQAARDQGVSLRS